MLSRVINTGRLSAYFVFAFSLCAPPLFATDEMLVSDYPDVTEDLATTDKDSSDSVQKLSTVPEDPLHPLADTNTSDFKKRYADYLEQWYNYKRANTEEVVEDPLHPLVGTKSAAFKTQHAEYLRQQQEYIRARYPEAPVNPLHPLADTDSPIFKAQYDAYLKKLDEYKQLQTLNSR